MRILLAYDASPPSVGAINLLSQLPMRKPIDFELVSVVAAPSFVSVELPDAFDRLSGFIEQEKLHVRHELNELSEQLQNNDHVHAVHQHTPVGPPTSELLEIADQTDSDLIVMGSVGHSAIGRMLLGSVSDYVATHADISTLVVRPRSDSEEPEFNKIMLALSGQPEDQRMLNWLKGLKLRPNVEIHLVRILDHFKTYRQDLRSEASEVWQEQIVQAQAQILSFETELLECGMNTETHLVDASHAGEALVEYANRHGCDLIMTGDSDSGLLTRVFLGSTSSYVLRHAGCSVLIVRDKKDRTGAHREFAQQKTSRELETVGHDDSQAMAEA